MIAVRAQDLDESERAMGNGISLIALPQWYVPCVMLIAVA